MTIILAVVASGGWGSGCWEAYQAEREHMRAAGCGQAYVDLAKKLGDRITELE